MEKSLNIKKSILTVIIIASVAVGAVATYFTNSYMEHSIKAKAQDGDLVSVLYTGKLTDGTVFDASSKHDNKPISFVLGANMVIKGWDEGLIGMEIGEKKTLTIAPEKAYGAQGIPDGKGGYIIPQNATLVFDVELVDIKRKP